MAKSKADQATKSKGALATAKALAKKAEAAAKKQKRKAVSESESDELLNVVHKKRKGGEEEEEERGEGEEEESEKEESYDSSSSTSSVAVAKENIKIGIKKKNAELVSLTSDEAKIEDKIKAAKKRNAEKGQELFKTLDAFPVEVSALISCFRIANADKRIFCRLLRISRKL